MLQLVKRCLLGCAPQLNADSQAHSQTHILRDQRANGAVLEMQREHLQLARPVAGPDQRIALDNQSQSMRSVSSDALPLNRLDKRVTGKIYTRLVSDTGKSYDLITRIDPQQDSVTARSIQDILKSKRYQKNHTGSLILGQGSFGTVRLAKTSENQLIAVKKVANSQAAALEVASDKLMKKLPVKYHQYFVITKDIVIAQNKNGEDKAYLFQDLMRHGDISSSKNKSVMSSRFKSLDEIRRLEVATQLVRPVALLHKHGLAHLDIKPANYLFDTPSLKLADLGFLTDEHFNLRRLGTPQFMPPENGSGACRSAQSDNFALGVMLYDLAGFKHPYEQFEIGCIDIKNFNNSQLRKSHAFFSAANNAMQQNKNSPTLETIALHLMHPAPQNRLTAAGAYDHLQALIAIHAQQL